VELRVNEAGEPRLVDAPRRMSTFDKNAVEEALRLKNSISGDITVLSLGGGDAKKTIKEALAMGCDKGVLIIGAPDLHDALTTSYFLSRAIEKFGPFDLILCSEGSSDVYSGEVPPMLSQWLSYSFLGYVRKLEVEDGAIRCEQALEDRVMVLKAHLPAVVAVMSEINEPRYPTLIQIMQASKKPLLEVASDELRDGRAPPVLVSTLRMSGQSMSRKRIIFEGAPGETAKKMLEVLSKEGVLKG